MAGIRLGPVWWRVHRALMLLLAVSLVVSCAGMLVFIVLDILDYGSARSAGVASGLVLIGSIMALYALAAVIPKPAWHYEERIEPLGHLSIRDGALTIGEDIWWDWRSDDYLKIDGIPDGDYDIRAVVVRQKDANGHWPTETVPISVAVENCPDRSLSAGEKHSVISDSGIVVIHALPPSVASQQTEWLTRALRRAVNESSPKQNGFGVIKGIDDAVCGVVVTSSEGEFAVTVERDGECMRVMLDTSVNDPRKQEAR